MEREERRGAREPSGEQVAIILGGGVRGMRRRLREGMYVHEVILIQVDLVVIAE